MRGLLLILFLFIALSAQPQTGQKINAVIFKIKNFGVTVEGTFSAPTGVINFDVVNPANSNFDVVIDTKSINTGITLRDNHLMKGEYFGVDTYPQIRFKSTLIAKDSKSEKWIVTGNLTIKNITKQISIPFTLQANALVGNFTMNRRQFNVGGKSLSMADEVIIKLNVMHQKL